MVIGSVRMTMSGRMTALTMPRRRAAMSKVRVPPTISMPGTSATASQSPIATIKTLMRKPIIPFSRSPDRHPSRPPAAARGR